MSQMGFFDDQHFDPDASAAAGLEGMRRAVGAERVQPYRVTAAIWLRSQKGKIITADDLVMAIGLPDHGVNKNNSVGAIISGWAKTGRVKLVGMRKTGRVVGHARTIREWLVL